MDSDDDEEKLAHFLESEVLSEFSDQEYLDTVEEENECHEVERDGKRLRIDECEQSEQEEKEQKEAKKVKTDEDEISDEGLSVAARSSSSSLSSDEQDEVASALSPSKKIDIVIGNNNNGSVSAENKLLPRKGGSFSQIPSELLFHILKFLSSEDLVSCSLVCRFLNFAAADESLWRHLYCMRWGILPPKRPRECAWKMLYVQRDKEDMTGFIRDCPSEFKEYYIQMQVAKRSQAPHPSQVNDNHMVLDKTLADQVSMWRRSRSLADTMVVNHACSGDICTYYRIGDVFVCEKTGNVHVCDDTCKEITNPTNELMVCTISGRCFDRLVAPVEMEPDAEQQQVGVTEEAESFMESGRFDRAYIFGYNCEDEKELEAAWRFC